MGYSIYIKKFKNYLIEEKKSSIHTIESYVRDVRQFFEFCLNKNISDLNGISKTHIISYLLFLQKKGRATSTISRSLASLRALFHYLFNNRYIDLDPTANLETPKIEKKIPQTLSVEEVEILLGMPDLSSKKGLRDKAILEILYASGLRVSELIHLRLQDIHLQERYIVCSHDNNDRMIPIGNTAAEALERYIFHCRKYIISDEKQDVLFVNMKGKEMSRQGLWKIIKFYTQRANIKKSITPQMIRHSFALHLIQNGAGVHAVQELLGHSEISSTQVYIQASSENISEIYRKNHPRA